MLCASTSPTTTDHVPIKGLLNRLLSHRHPQNQMDGCNTIMCWVALSTATIVTRHRRKKLIDQFFDHTGLSILHLNEGASILIEDCFLLLISLEIFPLVVVFALLAFQLLLLLYFFLL